jgi:DNA-binding response OmpR family regulator
MNMTRNDRLLLVDDDPAYLETAAAILSSRFDCTTVRTGEAALAADLTYFDAVLLDIELGHGMDGF